MLPKQNRVDKKNIDLIFKEGRFISSENISFKYVIKNNLKSRRISFITPKSVAKLAVTRNKLRRIGYRALEDQLHAFPVGILGVFVFKKYQDDILIIKNEIKNILTKIN